MTEAQELYNKILAEPLIEGALDIMFGELDDLHRKGEFKISDDLCGIFADHAFDLKDNLSVLIGILTITLPVPEKVLPNRNRAYKEIEKVLIELGRPVKPLLGGLEHGGWGDSRVPIP